MNNLTIMQYYAVLDFHLPLKAGSVYGFMYACCIYSRNIEGCYSEFSYIEKVDLGCEKGKHVEIPFLFWIQFYTLLSPDIQLCTYTRSTGRHLKPSTTPDT